MSATIALAGLHPVPEEFRPESYFDLDAGFARHKALFDDRHVIAALEAMPEYLREWQTAFLIEHCQTPLSWKPKARWGTVLHGSFKVYVEKGAVFSPRCIVARYSTLRHNRIYVGKGSVVVGADIYVEEGEVIIGENNRIEAGACIQGPSIIGDNNQIRAGAYLRGPVLIGNEGCFGGELKNVIAMDRAQYPHHSYVGDSILGVGSHFGNQATAANFGIFQGLRTKEERQTVKVRVGDQVYDTGRAKLGVIMGDSSQVGCNSVLDPGTFLRPRTVVYALSRVNCGIYGPDEVLKNKPMEKGVIERASLK
ncbi:hypothetical protein JXA32_03965 [Candidatus Sumerlaeota bacterium]|nr:hypothetical protein [Candidatus Sumerlaeota bacterium]